MDSGDFAGFRELHAGEPCVLSTQDAHVREDCRGASAKGAESFSFIFISSPRGVVRCVSLIV